MVFSLDIGDPYLEWNEENYSRDEQNSDENEVEEMTAQAVAIQNLKDAVVKNLISEFDFTMEEAETAVSESFTTDEDGIWNENADAKDLAKFLASEDDAE